MSKERLSLFLRPEWIFFFTATFFGILFAIFIPYGAGFDEEQHVLRIYDAAAGRWLPNQPNSKLGKFLVPVDFFRYSYQRRFFQTPAFDLFSGDAFNKPLDRQLLSDNLTRSIYSPFNFLPQSAVARLFWLKYTFPVVPVAILARIAGLMMYVGLTFLAIRLLPIGRWLMVVLGLAPSALFQAATLNADGFTNAVCFLFVAVTLNLALDDRPLISGWKIALLIVSILLVGAAKPGMFVLFPILAILPLRRFPGRGWRMAIAAAVIIAFGFAVQYNTLAVQSSDFMRSDRGNFYQQVQRILQHPTDFLFTLFWGNLRAVGNYYTEWIAAYGHWVGVVPEPVFVLFSVALVLALLIEPNPARLTVRQRWILGGVSFISSAVFAFLYTVVMYTPGSLEGFGHQGRYYIPTAPLLWLGLTGLVSIPNPLRKKAVMVMLASAGLSLSLYTIGLYATYYTYCGTAVYTMKGCVQPIYKNINWRETPRLALTASTLVRQEFPNRCGPIEQVQVYIDHDNDPDTFLIFTLKDPANRLLYEEIIPGEKLPESNFLTISIPKEVKEEGSVIEIQARGHGNIELALNGGDYFREASLSINGEAVADDLVFRYVCQPFWKQVVHNAGRQGKDN